MFGHQRDNKNLSQIISVQISGLELYSVQRNTVYAQVSVTCCLHSFLALLCLPFVGRTTIEDESRCGRPLGLAIASSTAPYDLLIADSYHGILVYNLRTKELTTLLNTSASLMDQVIAVNRTSSAKIQITWERPACDNGVLLGYTVSPHHLQAF